MANADDSVMALGVVVHGNAPIKIAARMPNRKPNVVLMPRSCMAADFRIVSTPHSGIGTPRLPTQRARETVNRFLNTPRESARGRHWGHNEVPIT